MIDDYKAKIWAKVLTDIRLLDSAAIKTDNSVGWAIRQNNPELQKDLNRFLKKVKKGTLLGNMLINRYYGKTKWVNNPNTEADREKLRILVDLFKK